MGKTIGWLIFAMQMQTGLRPGATHRCRHERKSAREFQKADQRDPRPAAPRLTRKRKAAEIGPQQVVVYVTTVQLSRAGDSTRYGLLLEDRIQPLVGTMPTTLRGREKGSIAELAAAPYP